MPDLGFNEGIIVYAVSWLLTVPLPRLLLYLFSHWDIEVMRRAVPAILRKMYMIPYVYVRTYLSCHRHFALCLGRFDLG